MAQSGNFTGQTPEAIERLIALNVTALTRLASAAAPRFVKTGEGAIVNISSVVGLAPEFAMTVYGATKAFVLFLSQGLHIELSSAGVYVRAVLPAGTYTEIWERAGIDISKAPEMMEVGQLVDAAPPALIVANSSPSLLYKMLPTGMTWRRRVRLCWRISIRLKRQNGTQCSHGDLA